MSLRVLHTSDWHLGRSLYGQTRYDEFDALMDWMIATLTSQRIDVLLIAGDVFDTGTPGNRALRQYYDFLQRVASTGCQHVVIIGGNHDSPSLLNAPQQLLRSLHIHVVGTATGDIADELVQLTDAQGETRLIVCAVPYLRDRDIRTATAGESVEDKEQKLLAGIRDHYQQIGLQAQSLRQSLSLTQQTQVPIIAMGHLFTAGAKTVDGDGVRDLYVGSLAHVSAGIFPDVFDYVALGHLHVPQTVGGQPHIRYSGSPIAMGFGEALQQKSVCVVTLDGTAPSIELVPVPVFQALRTIRGDLSQLQSELQQLASSPNPVWVEAIYTGDDLVPDLREQLETKVVNILRIKNQRVGHSLLQQETLHETLDELTPAQVFERCLSARAVPDSQQEQLKQAYQEILLQLQETQP